MVKGAIFDLDGTLLDSMFIWDTFAEDYLRSLGIEPKEELSGIFKTFTIEQSAAYYRSNYNIDLSIEEICDDIKKKSEELYREKAVLKRGVRKFLKRLYNRGVKMCVATATDKTIAEDVLKRLNVLEYFSVILTCSEVGCNKETPGIYRQSLEYLGTDKCKTIVFEDALHAVITAKNDGFKVAAVYDASEPEQEEMKKNADYYITDFESFCLPSEMKTALTIAGSDSSGGAGIQADIKTMTMNGVYAMSVITALTAQNTLGVRGVFETTPDFLKEQLDAVFEDIYPDSVKIGMVSSKELIDVISERLSYYNAKNIVVDPVMVATSGSSLIKTDAIKALISKLFPQAILVTPNIPEAEVLSGMKIQGIEDMINSAKYICETCGCSVLLKGGHNISDATDFLCHNGNITRFEGKRIENPNTHGTGCTLSSAIASNLAKGLGLEDAIAKAKEYITEVLAEGLNLGSGSGPLMHNFSVR